MILKNVDFIEELRSSCHSRQLAKSSKEATREYNLQKTMLESLQSRIGLAAVVIITAAIVMVIVLSIVGGGITTSGNPNDDNNSKRIIAYTTSYKLTGETITPVHDFRYVKLDEVPSNTALRFLTPFGKTMSAHFSQQMAIFTDVMAGEPDASMTEEQKTVLLEGADAFEQYILIRLPEFIVGPAVDNVTAFRAYSALDPESKCLLGYRHDLDASVTLQDPCHSDIFRVHDGYSCFGQIAVGTNPVVSSYNALPRMELSADSQGYLVAIRPDGQPRGDGTVGEGRLLSNEAIQQGNEIDPSCEPYAQWQQ